MTTRPFAGFARQRDLCERVAAVVGDPVLPGGVLFDQRSPCQCLQDGFALAETLPAEVRCRLAEERGDGVQSGWAVRAHEPKHRDLFPPEIAHDP